jgi:hypothetical protein
MTADEFRSMALGFPGAFESAHMNHPDFRVEGIIFASLGYPDETFGMVNLTPEQQRLFVGKAPGVFNPCRGAWGLRGATNVHLTSAKRTTLHSALEAAYRKVYEKVKTKEPRRKH